MFKRKSVSLLFCHTTCCISDARSHKNQLSLSTLCNFNSGTVKRLLILFKKLVFFYRRDLQEVKQ